MRPDQRKQNAVVSVWMTVGVMAAIANFAQPVDAYQVKRVIRGSVNMGSTTEVLSVDLTGNNCLVNPCLGSPVDPLVPSHTLVMATNSASLGTNDRRKYNVIAELQDAQTLLLARFQSTVATNVEFVIVEFSSGVTVQSGTTTFSDTTTTVNVQLPTSVTLATSFPFISWKNFNGASNNDYLNLFMAEFTSTTNLQLTRTAVTANFNNDVFWQVVTFDTDVNVQSGTVVIDGVVGAGETSDNGTALVAPITSVPANSSFLFFTTKANSTAGGAEDQYQVDGYQNSATQLTFNRVSNVGAVTIKWYLLTFQNNNAYTQTGRVAASTAGQATTASPTSTDNNRTMVRVSASGVGSGGAGDNNGLDETSVRGQLTNTTTVTMTREPSGGTPYPAANISWETAELPMLTVTAPNGGEVWRVGATQNITWTHAKHLEATANGGDGLGTCSGAGTAHKLKIDLSTDSGSTYPLSITSNVCANLDTYAWTIPATISTTNLISANLRVKITDQDYTATTRNFDTSNANFEIKGTIAVTAPNGGETWFVGDTNRNITWTKNGDLSYSSFTIEYSTDGGSTYPNSIVTGLTQASACSGNNCSYTWPSVADSIGSNLRVRVKLAADATNVFGASAANFTIKGTLSLTYPTASGITLLTQNAYSITWNKTGTFPAPGGACVITNAVDLYYSTNSGGSFPNTIATCQAGGASSGSYSWTVPTSAVTSFARVLVQQTGDTTVNNKSGNDFTILASLTVNSPNGSEVWQVASSHNVTWTVNGAGIATVKLEYSTTGCGGVYQLLDAGSGSVTASLGTYSWTIPDAIGGNVCVKVTNTANASVFATSAAVFRIQGAVQVTFPNGGQTLPIAGSYNIQWNNIGTISGTVEIRYSTDGGSTYPTPGNVITTGLALSGPTGSYLWTNIPDVAGGINNSVKIKLFPSDVTNVATGESAAVNSIKGTLTLTAPSGGQRWLVGSTQNITWTKTGSIGNVEFQYSKDGGVTYGAAFPVGGVTAGSSPYPWTIPDDISSQVRVRVRLIADNTVNGYSGSNLSIIGSLTLTAPVGGEVWKVGETIRNITWNSVGTTGNMSGSSNLTLKYSVNGGLDGYPYTITTAATASTGTYNWSPIPDAIGTQLRVKIVLNGDALVTDSSAANFTIKGQLTNIATSVLSPLIVGSTTNITWTTSGTIANVNLYYSTDGGVTFPNTIASNISNISVYNNWTVPDAIGTQVQIKVANVADSTVLATTSNFTIKGSLTITAPNGGETWIVGAGQNITWTKTGTLSGNIKLLYSTDGGATYPDPGNLITQTTLVTALSYAWTIPDAIGTTVRVKIIYLNDTTVTGQSAANFSIKGSLTITAPNGGEVWDLGSTQNITWTKTGTLGNVKLEYSTDGGSTYPNLITGLVSSTSPYAWTLPTSPASATVKVKITLLSDSTVTGASGANFRMKGKLTLTSPVGGETWVVGQNQNITWTNVGNAIANAKLEYSTDGGTTYPAGNLIVASTPAGAGSYTWTVADGISAQVRVRISDAADSTVTNASPANFTIKGSLTLTAPNGGEVWVVGTSQNITWTKTGTIPNVKLDYSTDGGTTYPNAVVASTSGAALSYAWTIPDAIGTTLRVKITDLNAVPATPSTSASNFTIKGSITVTAPNGGEQWPIGSSQNITWTKTGTLTGNLKLEYSTDGGVTYPVGNLISNTVLASSTSYAWTIPDNPTIQARVRVTQLNDTSVNSQSSANFSLKGSLTLTAPVGGEVWVVGQSRNITWTKGGALVNSRLDLSTDGGITYPVTIVASVPTANLVYAWTVSDNIGTQARVKITDLNDSTVTNSSPANFTIKGSLTITAPNGGETWIVNSAQNITWTKTGTIANVKLEYSTDGGVTYPNTIANPVPGGNLTYAWTVPDAIGSQLRVKITNLADTTVTSNSAANFTVKGALTLTSPNGGETWFVGDSRNITWTKVGSIANVKLEYSTNGGTTYPNVIIASTPATALTYAWTVPDAIGTLLRVRISDASDSTVNASSAANFTVKGKLLLTAPNGGEAWTVSSVRNVTWTRTGSIVNVKLQYSIDGGATFPNNIVLSTDASTGTYAWTIPDTLSQTAKVRVSDASDATVLNDSAANFKIVGSFTLTSPNGGENWPVGSSQNITWNKTGSIANAKLEYSTDGGTTYSNLIVAATPASNLTYAWTVPDSIGTNRRVRISDATDATVLATSAANFAILAGFAITVPNGGEVWTVGQSQNITWTTTGSLANVKLEYSTDGGVTYPNTITASTTNTGTYGWTVPDAISATVRVRISDPNNANAFKVSNANFKIRGAFTITAPNGGEGWPISTIQNITWTRTGSIANAKLEYSTDGGVTYPNLIVASTPAANLTYAWTIPNTPSATARVRITDVTDATVFGASNANFSIKGSLTITAPNGGEAWIVGSSYNVTWTMFGAISNVKIQYSSDGGTTWPDPGKVITTSTAASLLSYTWTIPDDISSTVKVRISDTGDPSVLATSAANFSIKGSLTVTSPNGGENWVVATTQNITWTKTGTIPNVKLEYSKDAFADELQTFLITASVPSAPATYAWTIPDAIGSTVKVRVSNVTDATVKGVSAGNFAIKGSVTVNAPNGGEVWIVGSSQPVTWSKVGSIANVKIDYSTDGGVSYPNPIVASVAASAGSYSWTIPDNITTTARVRVADASDATVFSTSAANFKIAGSLTVTAPAGGESWIIGGSQNITWTKTGSIANVKLEYSTDGGTTYPNLIVASVPATTGTPYAWTIPDNPTTTARVRITNTADATVFATSAANFNIRGSLTLTAPVGGEVWVVGATQNITWTKMGSLANVKLEYSTDGGATYPNLITASTAASALTYAWTVPDAISSTVRVKITYTGDAAVTSASPANFKIKGSVTVTAPNGGEVWIVGATQNITWTKSGSFANVKLDYSTDGGLTYPNAITASTPAAPLSYTWTIPDAIGTTLRVQVANAADTTATVSTSASNFTIKGSLTITAPNGGETWIVGASQNITWAKTGTIALVKLEYSTDGGVTYPNLITASTSATPLSYAWTIPDSISSTVKVKITNLADTTVVTSSAANFKIAGSLTLTSPVGGEVWIVGQTRNITWTKTGSIATARLDYSTDGGVSYPNVITLSVAAANLTFAWTVPDNMSSTVKVKLANTADTTVFSASAANFKIAGSFTLTSPVGGEKWAAGSLQSITWTKTGSIVNAKLEYSTDGGVTYPNLIVATTPAANLSYAWTLGSTTSTQVRVRVTDVSDSTVFATSAANFKIMGGFTLTAPNGGEVWVVGTSQNITWTTSGSVANVKLSYSIDGGTTYPSVIAATTANTGSYAWTIPDVIGTTLRVKVEDVLDVDAFKTSAANFKIKGSLTVSAPNGGEVWTVASINNITWTKTGSIANVKIEYSTDGGTTYPAGNLIAASAAAGPGTYSWTVPDAISTTVRVRLTDVTDATVTGVSSANFTIRGSFTLTAPVGGEKWTVGSTQSITWTTFGTIANVKLEYSTDGGTTYPNVIAASVANTGTYSWAVPNAISATVRVRISNAADLGTFATSPANFKIRAGFTLTAPAGGEVWVVGTSQNITWTTAGTVSNVKLEYSTDGGVTYPAGNLISASAPNTGTFAWTVPNAISATVRVRVSDATDTVDAFTTSAANFKIRAGFTLTAPAGGEAWAVGTTHNITWTTAGTIANVKLEYSTDSGATYPNVIVASTANTGTYAWVIPDAITAAARVRVSDVNDVTANATSGTNFKIQGSLTITAPNGGEQWTVGSIRTITWNRTGSIAFVKLDFSTNGGGIYAPITASTSNTGSYAWTIPDNISTNCLVKVSDTNDATVFGVSAAAFKIQAGFTVTSPAGGEVWGVGSARTTTWTTQGTVSFVKIDYSTDGGVTYPSLITSSTSNTGTYAWTVPDNVTGSARVRVSQTTDAQAFGASAGNFRIRALFSMISPNGGEQWRVGQVQNVTWSVVGTIPNVKLQYSRDGFNVDLQTISAAAPSTGTYAWTIPDAISNTVTVRVSDPNDIGAFAGSAANFRITGDFTVTAPNGGEKWNVASVQNITWTKAGSVTNAKIEYSTNSGGTWTTIAGLTPNNGTFAWTIPDAITAQGRVRLSDPNDATANAISAADFKIKAAFTVTAPVGGEVWTVGTVQNITWTNTGTVPNVKLDYSTNSGTTYAGVIAASAPNTGTYAWTIPDAISTGVRVRVSSVTDSIDAFATSPADFKIRGSFTVTAPNGGEGFKIAQTQNITWTTVGTMPTVKLSYSTDSGATYPNVITASVANTNTYAWVVPDNRSTTARVRVEYTADSTVFATSAANFSIQGNFTITAPNGGETWSVGDVRNITWSWGGTIPNVKLSYSTDGGVTYPTVIAASAPNGAGSSGTFSYAWTIPDSISTTVRVKIQDVGDATVFATSAANFKIQGKLTMVAPNGGERWVVNQTKTILWTTNGTVPTVKLEYSTDSGATYSAGNLIVASVANTGSYNWVIPNNLSTTARVRVSNTADTTVFGQSAADFKIDYYQITFQVKDLLSNNNLDQITVNASTNPAAYTWAASGQTSPIVKGLQGGTWSATFTRVSYGDQTVNFVADSDQTIQVFMETQVVHIWEAVSELNYNTSTDTLSIGSTLRRDGITVSGATSCTVNLYNAGALFKSVSNPGTPDANGFYHFTISAPTGLVAGTIYDVVTTITIATGGTFKSPRTFSITDVKKLQDVQDTVNQRLDTPLSQVNTNLQNTLNAQTNTINSTLNNQTNTMNSTLNNQTNVITQKLTDTQNQINATLTNAQNQINATLTSFETKADQQITSLKQGADDVNKSAEQAKGTNTKFLPRLVGPSDVLVNDNFKLRLIAITGVSPTLTITTVDFNNQPVVIAKDVAMIQSATDNSIYEYSSKATVPPYVVGKGVVAVATIQNIFKYQLNTNLQPETATSTIQFTITSATLADVAASVSALGGLKGLVTDIGNTVKKNDHAASGDTYQLLVKVAEEMHRLPSEVAKAVNSSGSTNEIKSTLNKLADQINTLAGNNGYNFKDLVKGALDESSSMKDVVKRSTEIQGMNEVMTQVMDREFGGKDGKVVIHSFVK